ncbi:unnamed protein product [Cyclocybe aegerita]|uniref:Uncharacterized protein n=1 Tax=Cyclocybe aegerita TaxID=1973307 RepID=A0A8S0XKP2_CYCAE|nr:unnamed protein product [Cyclocybe aegerita]
MPPRPSESSDASLFEEDFTLPISLATTMLKSHSRGPPTVAEQLSAPLDIMQYIATLLTTGDPDSTPGETKGSRVVAVTGRASADSIEALAVATRHPYPTQNFPVMDDISDEDVDSTLRAVKEWQGETPRPSFEEYSKTVFAMLNYFRANKRAPSTDFLRYVIRQCYPKIVSRMQLANVVWEEPPLTVIENYFKGDYSFNPSKPFPWKLRIRKGDSFMVDRLELCRSELDARTATYEVNANNVVDWVNELVAIYNDFTKYLSEPDERGTMKAKPALTRELADAALLDMLSLDAVMIRMGFLEHLLSDREPANELARKSVTYSGTADEQSDEEEFNEEDRPEEDEDESDGKDGARGGHPSSRRAVLQVCICLGDGRPLRHPLRAAHPLRAYLITMPSPGIGVNIGKARVQSAKTSLFESVPAKVRPSKRMLAEKWLEDRYSTCFRSSESEYDGGSGMPGLHAEAALMALSCYFKDPGVTVDSATRTWGLTPAQCRILFRVFSPPNPTVIGVGTRCCWCCWRLKTLLNDRKGPASGSGNEEVVMLGTHATIDPWCPPQIGIPLDILRKLENELEGMLVDAAERNLRVGRRSSSRSPGGSSGRDSPVPQWDYDPELDTKQG